MRAAVGLYRGWTRRLAGLSGTCADVGTQLLTNVLTNRRKCLVDGCNGLAARSCVDES